MLQPYPITLHVYAESKQEAEELETALREFVVSKYNQQVYIRAAALTNVVRRYGNSPIVNNFIQ